MKSLDDRGGTFLQEDQGATLFCDVCHQQVRSNEVHCCLGAFLPAFLSRAPHETFVLLKPDGMRKQLLGAFLLVLKAKRLRADSVCTGVLSAARVDLLYGQYKHRKSYAVMKSWLTSGPSAAIHVTGAHAVSRVRALMGIGKFPYPKRTFRGEYATTQQRNVLHASDSSETAQRELEYFF